MKKLLLTILFAMLMTPMLAEEVQNPTQTQKAKDVKGSIVIKKQPSTECAKQVQQVEKVYGSIIIFVQGKLPGIEKDK